MKHHLLELFFTLFGLFFSLVVVAQINVFHVNEQLDLSEKHGFFYSLPQTVFRVELVVEKTEYNAGPYAPYAEEYLGLQNVVKYDFSNYKIIDVKLGTTAVPDPEQFYFVELGDKLSKKDKELLLAFSEAGLISGINEGMKGDEKLLMGSTLKETEDTPVGYFRYSAERNLYEKFDTLIQRVVVDTVTVEKIHINRNLEEKSSENKAMEIAEKITQIRESKYNLISGYQEIPYEAASLTFMSRQLKEMEDEYLSLFTGVTIKKTLNYKFFVNPDADVEGR
jgi:hypothetical protein